MLNAVHGFVRTFFWSTCVGIIDKKLFIKRVEVHANGVLDDAIAKRRGRDTALLAFA